MNDPYAHWHDTNPQRYAEDLLSKAGIDEVPAPEKLPSSIITLLGNSRHEIRRSACTALVLLAKYSMYREARTPGDPNLLRPLLARLGDPEEYPDVWYFALQALDAWLADGVSDDLLPLIRDVLLQVAARGDQLQSLAIRLLTQLASDIKAEVVCAWLRSEQLEVRRAALLVVATAPDSLLESASFLEDTVSVVSCRLEEPALRLEALRALPGLGAIVSPLLCFVASFLEDCDEDVRHAASVVLSKLARTCKQTDLDALVQQMESLTLFNSNPEVCAAAIRTVGLLGKDVAGRLAPTIVSLMRTDQGAPSQDMGSLLVPGPLCKPIRPVCLKEVYYTRPACAGPQALARLGTFGREYISAISTNLGSLVSDDVRISSMLALRDMDKGACACIERMLGVVSKPVTEFTSSDRLSTFINKWNVESVRGAALCVMGQMIDADSDDTHIPGIHKATYLCKIVQFSKSPLPWLVHYALRALGLAGECAVTAETLENLAAVFVRFSPSHQQGAEDAQDVSKNFEIDFIDRLDAFIFRIGTYMDDPDNTDYFDKVLSELGEVDKALEQELVLTTGLRVFEAFCGCALVGPMEEAVNAAAKKAAVPLLTHPAINVRLAALASLRASRSRDTADDVAALLGDRLPDIQAAAASTLARFGAAGARYATAIVDILDSQVPRDCRLAVCSALARLRREGFSLSARACEILENVAANDGPERSLDVRRAAADALGTGALEPVKEYQCLCGRVFEADSPFCRLCGLEPLG